MYDPNDPPVASAKPIAFPDIPIEELEAKVKSGDVMSSVVLGNFYETGHGVEQDFEKAFKLYNSVVDSGDRVAEFYLAMCYDAGTGVSRNKEKAFSLYTSAAEKGAPMAQFLLGHCYARAYGYVGQPDYIKAAEWYLQSAQNGIADGWFFLGYLSEGHELGEPNIERALQCYQRAADGGSERAIKVLDDLKQRENLSGEALIKHIFGQYGISQGGEDYYPLNVALAITQQCNQQALAVIGLEFFTLAGERIKALPQVMGADWSDLLEADSWEAAVIACNQATARVLQNSASDNPDYFCCLELIDQSEWRS